MKRNLITSLLMFLAPIILWGQSVSGVVSDGDKPLAGANVVVEGTDLGTVSADDGSYSVDVPSGQYDITANAVCPGLTDYETSLNTAPPNYRKAFLSQVSMGRTGHASEIAEAVLFLASSRASFINGEVLHVDGGYSAGKPNVSRHNT